ncbi:Rv3235 family protein [Mariniluteicoccus flavus]
MSIALIPDPRPLPTPRPLAALPTPAASLTLRLVDPMAVPVVTDAEPPAVETALRLARAAADLAVGRRTPAQLVRWTTAEALDALNGWARAQDPRVQWQVQSLRAQQPAVDVVETCARLTAPTGRSIALALRLERTAGSWLCTVADLGPARAPREARSTSA